MAWVNEGNPSARLVDITSHTRGHHRSIFFILFALLVFMSPGLNAQMTSVISPDEVRVGDKTVFQVDITVTDSIEAGSEIVLYTPAGLKNLIWPVFSNIEVSNSGNASLEITSVTSALLAQSPIWDNDNLPTVIFALVRNHDLVPGDFIRFTIGDDDLGELFLVEAPVTAGTIYFKTAVVSPGGEWMEINVLPLQLLARDAAYIHIFMPSVSMTGSEAVIKASAWDVIYNRSKSFTGRLAVQSADPAVQVADDIVFSAADSGYVEIPVTFTDEGIYRLEAELTEATNSAAELSLGQVIVSNYTWVQDDPEYYIYWGDLHSHSGWSRDGQGSKSFDYARRTSCLDYFAPAEHVNGDLDDTLGINEQEWTRIKDCIIDNHEPGVFIPVTAYETSYYANEGGHQIAYFEHDDSAIHEIPLLPRKVYRTVFDIVEQLDLLPSHISALYFPHFTGEIFYQDFSDPEWGLDDLSINQGDIPRLVGEEYISDYRPLFEMYSEHGQSELFDPDHPLNGGLSFWFVQDALAMGEKVGFTAFTDNHLGKPGYPGGGKGALLAPELSRSEVFKSLRARQIYATTGERIIMDFRINDSIMGREVDISIDMVPQIEFMVQGTAPLERVEVLKWDFIFGSYGDDYHPDFETIWFTDITDGSDHFSDEFQDIDFYGHAVYYLRVVQNNEVEDKPVWGWSSPIWVNNLNLDTTITSLEMFSGGPEIGIYPNPVAGNSVLTMQIQSKEPMDVHLVVIDSKGALQSGESCSLHHGMNDIRFPVNNLPAGQYWMRLTKRSGSLLGCEPFIVQ